MPGGLTLLESLNADIPTPPAGKVTIYFSIDITAPAYKDDAGVVHPLTGSAGPTGASGPAGPAGFADEPEAQDVVIALPGPQGNPGATGATGSVGPDGPPIIFIQDETINDEIPSNPAPASSGGGSWVLAAQQALSGAATYDFTGLGVYTDVIIRMVGVTFGSGAVPNLRVSIDNGSTFLAASGDYIQVAGTGAPTNATELTFYTTPATASRNGEIFIQGINLAVPKFSRAVLFATDGVYLRLIPTANAINALRIFASVNFTGGTAYILGRR